jgi:hypothetical protein
MSLKITYAGSLRGKRLYAISDGRERLFMGTLPEVKRYIVVRAEKIHRRVSAEQAYLCAVRTAG